MTATADNKKWVEVRLVRSLARRTQKQVATVKGLGLRRLGSHSKLELTPQVAGMIDKVGFLLEVKYL